MGAQGPLIWLLCLGCWVPQPGWGHGTQCGLVGPPPYPHLLTPARLAEKPVALSSLQAQVGKLAKTQLEYWGFFLKIFLVRAIFKVFIEFIKHCFCLMFRFFGHQAHGILVP